jgi:hypothetical protein
MAGSGAQGISTPSASLTTDPSAQESRVQDIEKASSKSLGTVEGSTMQENRPGFNLDAEPVQELPADLVDWDGESDPHKPMNWTRMRKVKNIVVICYLTFLTSVLSISSLFHYPRLQRELFKDSD